MLTKRSSDVLSAHAAVLLTLAMTVACTTQSSDAPPLSKSATSSAPSPSSPASSSQLLGSASTAASSTAAPSASASSSASPSNPDAQRNVGPFTAVTVSSGLEADIVIGPSAPLQLTGDDAIIGAVKTEVSGDVLTISFQGGQYHVDHPLHIRVTMPQVTSLEATSSAFITASGLACGELNVHAASSATIKVSGTCKKLGAKTESAAKLDAGGLSCDDVTVDAQSASDATIRATSSVNGSATSAAHLHVLGSPKQTTFAATSAATVD